MWRHVWLWAFWKKICFHCTQVLKVFDFETPGIEENCSGHQIPSPHRHFHRQTDTLTHTYTHTHTVSHKSEYSKPPRFTICACVIIFIRDDDRSLFTVLFLVQLEPFRFHQRQCGRCQSADSGMLHCSQEWGMCQSSDSDMLDCSHQCGRCQLAHASLLTSVLQVSVGRFRHTALLT